MPEYHNELAQNKYSMMRRFDEKIGKWLYAIIFCESRWSNGAKVRQIMGQEFDSEEDGDAWAMEMLKTRPWLNA